MLLIMIFDFFVGFADVYVAGFISPEVQAAVGFVSLLYFFVIIIANAISIGTVALVSRAIGGGDFGRALEVARQSLIFGCLVAVLLSLVGLFFSRQIVAAAGFPGRSGRSPRRSSGSSRSPWGRTIFCSSRTPSSGRAAM